MTIVMLCEEIRNKSKSQRNPTSDWYVMLSLGMYSVWSSAFIRLTLSVYMLLYMLYPHCTGLWLISLNCDLAPILGSLLPVADVVAVYHMIVLKGYWHSPLEGDAGRGG